jgi:phosphoribosylamine--glycine ligase
VAPGNGGTEAIATNLSLDINDFAAVKTEILNRSVDMVVVGPEDPLVNGIVDYLKAEEALKNLKIIGPGQSGAALEGSKDFAKQFMKKYEIPTASARSFNSASIEEGKAFLETLTPPYVLKADGLAAGKGVLITEDLEEAKTELEALLIEQKFGQASTQVLIEEYLKGIELSVFVLTDGSDYVLLPEAKDYKRIGEGDTGPNTGGMGAVSPVIFADRVFMERVEKEVIQPTVKGIKAEGFDYKGFIFFGLMNVKNRPYVIEYNVRMGDPETEVVMPRIKSDLVSLLEATASGKLAETSIEVHPYTATTLMLVSGGYPGVYEKGKTITFKDDLKGVVPFHAGTKIKDQELLTNGGRVVALTSLGKNLTEAMNKCYAAAVKVSWESMNYRKAIGEDLKLLGQ